RLTTLQEQEDDPAWSPDGSRLAFTWADATGLSCKGCPQDVHVANADGTGIVSLTSAADLEFDSNPAWSPDGASIPFEHSTASVAPDLRVVLTAGGAVRDLHVPGSWPAWGPSRIAYVGSGKNDEIVYTAKPDGTDRQKVAEGNLSAPAWSRDGRLAW